MGAAGIFVKWPHLVADRRITHLIDGQPGRACCLDMITEAMNMMFDFDHIVVQPEASTMTGVRSFRVKIADDDGRAVVGYSGEFGIGHVDFRQMAEHQPAPDDVEPESFERHFANIANATSTALKRTVGGNAGGEHLAAGLEADRDSCAGVPDSATGSAADIEQALARERGRHGSNEPLFKIADRRFIRIGRGPQAISLAGLERLHSSALRAGDVFATWKAHDTPD